MALILAIEPDRRQAAHLTTLMRTRVGAELVLADTAEHAIDAIGARVPELVLVPPLISPQDDAALAAALRVIAAATDVQVLTTPLFAVGRPESATGGPLSSLWRRRKARGHSEGCAPEVFAEQVVSYLQRVTADREQAASLEAATIDVREAVSDVDLAPPPAVADVAPPVPDVETAPPVPDVETAPLLADVEPVPPAADVADLEPARLAADAEPPPVVALPQAPPEVPSVAGLTLEAMLAELTATLVQPDEPVVQEITACEWTTEDSGFRRAVGDLHLGDAMTSTAEAIFDIAPEMEMEVEIRGPEDTGASDDPREIGEGIEASPLAAATPPPMQPSPFEDAVVESQAQLTAPAPPPLPTPVVAEQRTPDPKAQDRPEWVELIVSLRADIERLRAERAAPPVATARAASPEANLVPFPLPGARAASHRHRTKQKPRPIQDEWGFFDPEQCGFAALLAKLEEITDEREEASGGR